MFVCVHARCPLLYFFIFSFSEFIINRQHPSVNQKGAYFTFIFENSLFSNMRQGKVAVAILKLFSPTVLYEYDLIRVIGDGNGLFRAVALAIYESENYTATCGISLLWK